MSTAIKRLTALAEEQFDVEQTIKRLDEELKAAKERFKAISETEIPELMDDLELEEFKTKAGFTVEVGDHVHVGKVTNEAALAFVEEDGAGGMIKSDLVVAFDKGDGDKSSALLKRLEKQKFQVKRDEHIHSSTVKSYLTAKLEEGSIDEEGLKLFGAYVRRAAKIKLPKKAKKKS